MKIGIMTFWYWDGNYGSQLQCWALQQVLKYLGHQPYLIRYIPVNDFVPSPLWLKIFKAFNPIRLIKHVRYLMEEHAVDSDATISEKKQGFVDFRNKYISVSDKVYASYEQLRNDPPDAACYITGSDQVWNQCDWPTWKAVNINRAFFLDFGDSRVRRLSYAASWGNTAIKTSTATFLKPLLNVFTAVSVREPSGVHLCRECGCDKAVVTPDPTLLLGAEAYRAIEQKPQAQIPERYILFYSLSSPSSVSDGEILNWARKAGKKIVYITGNYKRTAFPQLMATTQEWLWLIDHAEGVVTNSYHCCLFSLTLGKPFAFNKLAKSYEFQNGRVLELGKWVNIEDRIFTRTEYIAAALSATTKVSGLTEFQADGLKFLETALV